MITAAMALGADVYMAREAAGLSETDLARRAGVSPAAVAGIETGLPTITPGTVRAVLRALDMDVRQVAR